MDAAAARTSDVADPSDLPDTSAPASGRDREVDREPAREPSPAGGDARHVCPYCGLAGPRPEGPCQRCTIEDSPQTRQATKARIGPWYVLQNRNPAAPGMKWSVLLALVKKGQVTPRSVVRGPTTHQLWRLANQIKGLSREFGVCYSCGGAIDRVANQCPHCDRLQEPPTLPDSLLDSREAGTPAARKLNELARTDGAEPTLPVRREIKPTEPGLLSARDLAAAFQLSFEGDGGADIGPKPGASSSPAVATASRPTAAPKPPVDAEIEVAPARRPRRVGRMVLVVLALALVGLAAVVLMTPEYKARASQYWSTAADWVQAQFARATPSTQPSVVKPADRPAADRTRSGGAAKSTADSSATTGERAQPPVVPPVPSTEVPRDPESIRHRIRTLRNAAIDAEAAGDYRSAVEHYEEIRKLPSEYWPSDLDIRVSAARARAN